VRDLSNSSCLAPCPRLPSGLFGLFSFHVWISAFNCVSTSFQCSLSSSGSQRGSYLKNNDIELTDFGIQWRSIAFWITYIRPVFIYSFYIEKRTHQVNCAKSCTASLAILKMLGWLLNTALTILIAWSSETITFPYSSVYAPSYEHLGIWFNIQTFRWPYY